MSHPKIGESCAEFEERMARERIEPRADNLPEKITAHVVRGLRECMHCEGIGHKDHMILGDQGHDGGEFYHTVCYVERYGFSVVLSLSRRNLGMFRMCDVSNVQMQQIITAFGAAE